VKRHWVDHLQNLVKHDDPKGLIDTILDDVDESLGLLDPEDENDG